MKSDSPSADQTMRTSPAAWMGRSRLCCDHMVCLQWHFRIREIVQYLKDAHDSRLQIWGRAFLFPPVFTHRLVSSTVLAVCAEWDTSPSLCLFSLPQFQHAVYACDTGVKTPLYHRHLFLWSRSTFLGPVWLASWAVSQHRGHGLVWIVINRFVVYVREW